MEEKSQQKNLIGQDESPPYFAGNDDFVWPEYSSSDDLPRRNVDEITMCSVPSTPESTPNGAVSGSVNKSGKLGFSDEKLPVVEKKGEDCGVVVVSSDDDDDESGNEGIRVNSGLKLGFNGSECLMEVLKKLCEVDVEKNGGKKVDILETVMRRGMTFPKHRVYD